MIFSKQLSANVRRLSVQRAIAVLVMSVSVLFMGTTVAQSQSIPCAQDSATGYVGKQTENAKAVIVFVHGILSDSSSAWTYSPPYIKRLWSSNVYWPCLMRNDTAFNDTNIYVYQYEAKLGPSPSIDKIADRLRQDLSADGVLRHPNIAFVTHSMGGLVTARMLLNPSSSTFLTNVKLVKFFGTPGSGPGFDGVKQWLWDKVRGTVSGEAFQQLMDVQYLRELRSSWSSRKWPFQTFCSSETTEIPPFGMIVPRESAASLCNGNDEQLEGLDHSAIVKPADRSVESYRRVWRRYSQCIRPHIRQSKAAEVALSDGGVQSLRWLSEFQDTQMKLEEGIDLADVKPHINPLLYSSWSNLYLSPKHSHSRFSSQEYESVSSNVFSPVLMSRLGTGQKSAAKHAWINLVRNLDDHVREPTFIAMRDGLIAHGISLDDYAIGLENKASYAGRRLVLIIGVEYRQGQQPLVGLKGFLDLPSEDDPCKAAQAGL